MNVTKILQLHDGGMITFSEVINLFIKLAATIEPRVLAEQIPSDHYQHLLEKLSRFPVMSIHEKDELLVGINNWKDFLLNQPDIG